MEPLRKVSIGEQVPQEAPEVSVVIPAYKVGRYIADTLASVFSQTFSNFEVIVLNDGSPDADELYRAIEPYRDRIKFVDKAANSGAAAARNLGARYARAGILIFLDGDDLWHPEFLARLLQFKKEGGYGAVYAEAKAFVSEPYTDADLFHLNPAEGEITRTNLINGECHILPSGTLVDAEAFHRVGGFDPCVFRSEDFDLWMRLLFDGIRFGYLRESLFAYRLRRNSLKGDMIQRIERCRDVWRVLQRKLPFTLEENAKVDLHIAREEAALLRAEGRLAVYQKDWATAHKRFSEALRMANRLSLPFVHRVKMVGVLLVLQLYPEIVRRLELKFRDHEIDEGREADVQATSVAFEQFSAQATSSCGNNPFLVRS